jgi:DNA-binding transcriptional LysR family regulator
VLPAALAEFHRQCPGARTRVIPGLSTELVNLVDAGDIDLAAVIQPPYALQGDLRWTALTHEPFRLIVPRNTPTTRNTSSSDWEALLAREPFIRYDRASFGGRLVDHFLRRLQLKVQEACELDELDAIVGLVAHGVGVALVPQTALYRRWPKGVRAIDLGHHTFHRDIGIVHRDTRQMGDPARLLLTLIEQEARV